MSLNAGTIKEGGKARRRPAVAPLERIITECDKKLLLKYFENKHPELLDRDGQLDLCSNIADRT